FSRDWSSDVCSSDLLLGAHPNGKDPDAVPGGLVHGLLRGTFGMVLAVGDDKEDPVGLLGFIVKGAGQVYGGIYGGALGREHVGVHALKEHFGGPVVRGDGQLWIGGPRIGDDADPIAGQLANDL